MASGNDTPMAASSFDYGSYLDNLDNEPDAQHDGRRRRPPQTYWPPRPEWNFPLDPENVMNREVSLDSYAKKNRGTLRHFFNHYPVKKDVYPPMVHGQPEGVVPKTPSPSIPTKSKLKLKDNMVPKTPSPSQRFNKKDKKFSPNPSPGSVGSDSMSVSADGSLGRSLYQGGGRTHNPEGLPFLHDDGMAPDDDNDVFISSQTSTRMGISPPSATKSPSPKTSSVADTIRRKRTFHEGPGQASEPVAVAADDGNGKRNSNASRSSTTSASSGHHNVTVECKFSFNINTRNE